MITDGHGGASNRAGGRFGAPELQALFAEHQPTLVARLRATHAPWVAEDAVSAVFTDAVARPERYDLGSGNELAWFTKRARSEAAMIERRNTREILKTTRLSTRSDDRDIDDWHQIDDRLDAPDTASTAIGKLNLDRTDDRMLYLHAVERLTYRQIAVRLEVTITRVKVGIHRARRRLRGIDR